MALSQTAINSIAGIDAALLVMQRRAAVANVA